MVAIVLGASSFAASSAARPAMASSLLDRLRKGEWEIRDRGGEMAMRRTCLGDVQNLIQLRHAKAPCERIATTENGNEVTVQYSCRGRGYGRTHIRLENPSLVQIDSQGIENGLPFSFTAEARRTGACPR